MKYVRQVLNDSKEKADRKLEEEFERYDSGADIADGVAYGAAVGSFIAGVQMMAYVDDAEAYYATATATLTTAAVSIGARKVANSMRE